MTASVRTFVALLRRDWREVRALTWTSMALVAAAAPLVRWVLGAIERDVWASSPGLWRGGYFQVWAPHWWEPFVPGAVALYAALITADAVGGEVASRRSDALALLPAGRTRIWAAKVTFLVAASLVFAAWTLLAQIATLWAADGIDHAAAFVLRAQDAGWTVGALVLLVASTLLVSTLRLRGIGAALVGAGVAAGLWIAGTLCAEFLGHREQSFQPYLASAGHRREWLAVALTAPAVLVAAGLAFVHGRVLLGRALRPAAITLATLVPALVAPAAVLARQACAIEPGADGVRPEFACPREDGRFVAVTFVNESSRRRPRKSFVLDVERGVLVEPDCGNLVVDPVPPEFDGVWDADGNLVVASFERTEDGRRVGVARVHVDPATGAVARRDAPDAALLHRGDAEWRESIRWYVGRQVPADDGGPAWKASLCDRWGPATPREVRSWVKVVLGGRRQTIAYAPEPRVLAVRTLPDGDERRVLVADEPWAAGRIGPFSQDGRELLVAPGGVWAVLDLATGRTTALPPCGAPPVWRPFRGRVLRRQVILRDAPKSAMVTLLDLDTGARLDAPAEVAASGLALPDGRTIVEGRDTLDLYDASYRFVRRLWPPGGAASGEGGTR